MTSNDLASGAPPSLLIPAILAVGLVLILAVLVWVAGSGAADAPVPDVPETIKVKADADRRVICTRYDIPPAWCDGARRKDGYWVIPTE